MQVFINEQEFGALPADGTTVGDVIDALAVHLPVDHVVTGVDVDGETFLAGSEERYVRRPSRSVRRLHLRTQGPAALADDLLEEVAGGLGVVLAKVDRTVDHFELGDSRAAQALLAELVEELHLLLVLEERVAVLGNRAPLLDASPFERVGERLIRSHESGSAEETARLLAEDLRPLLQDAAQRVERVCSVRK